MRRLYLFYVQMFAYSSDEIWNVQGVNGYLFVITKRFLYSFFNAIKEEMPWDY